MLRVHKSVVDASGTGVSALDNADAARSQHTDVELAWRPSEEPAVREYGEGQ